MRKNLPVTDTQYHMEDCKPIVSKTDLKGKITYVNPYFIEVSGFSKEELIGAPHNLVRHPDMPPEAFDDLWKSIKAGQPWTGTVKNRRKNGDFYWVVANVTPIMENGSASGYMSVRTKPTRAQIEAAERTYRSIFAGNPDRMVIREGQVVRGGLTGIFSALYDLPISALITLGILTLCALYLGMGVLGFATASGSTAWGFVGVAALGVASALLMGHTLHTSVAIPLRGAIRAARTIAGGDLTSTIETQHGGDMGQLLRALQQMNVNLLAIIGDVRTNVHAVNVATREIAAGNTELSTRTESQASCLEETASSMEEFSASAKQNADHAQRADELVLSASTVALKGGQAVASVGATMSDISASAKKIADIISLIDSIAFQTNILALNAAVEAARAGEQGRGFAVVASEVRSLAQRSAAAAKEIKGLIDDSVARVELGNRLVGDAEQTMKDIVESVRRVAGIMHEIASASREQSSGIDQVNRAIGSMGEVTQQNAGLVEQTVAVSSCLEDQAMQLSQAVSVFKLDDMRLHHQLKKSSRQRDHLENFQSAGGNHESLQTDITRLRSV
ncbi:methyl-accepting chemotaxis protein [Rugamonas apoptosis]|uniref:PAS domain-containing protein n=1 Tax=Rugamonas apoptosis TaxID=2758570 RepID=A0A7W2FDE6_9BURK|nr:PAS domain-containing methyl-accepting chemotaxis protein [Rugamonas apoptosis]MBA5689660.1 PAS domain-containing protein [Rugamonas apoptosis]